MIMFIYIIIFFTCLYLSNTDNSDNYKNIKKKLDQVHNNQIRIVEKFDDDSHFVCQLKTIGVSFDKMDEYLIKLEKINKTYIALDEKIKKIENMKNTIDVMKKRIIDLEHRKNDSFEVKLNESKKFNFII